MVKVIGVKFSDGGRIYYFSPNNMSIKKGNHVIVETERGLQYGQAVTDIIDKEENDVFLPLKNVLKLANNADKKNNQKNQKDAVGALEYAQKLVAKSGLDMKLFEAAYTFDRKKLIFKFVADERVDFRQLAKSLASKYKTRIELRQIGVRDKAKEIGGLGPCGRPLCCSTFLYSFDSVSINMAKNQGIALNPTKINGSCGRLLCCLGYEDETYTNQKKNLPKIGQLVKHEGKTGRVFELNILDKSFKILTDDNEEIKVSLSKDESN